MPFAGFRSQRSPAIAPITATRGTADFERRPITRALGTGEIIRGEEYVVYKAEDLKLRPVRPKQAVGVIPDSGDKENPFSEFAAEAAGSKQPNCFI